MIKLAAFLLFAIPMAGLFVVGVMFLASPETALAAWLPLGPVPNDGLPVLRFVYAPHRDAWSRHEDRFVGTAFVLKHSDDQGIVILEPRHAPYGSAVEYNADLQCFESCCFKIRYDLTGKLLSSESWLDARYADLRRFDAKISDGQVWCSTSDMSTLRP